MKKFLTILLTVTLLLGTLAVFSASAEGETSTGDTPEGTPVSSVKDFFAIANDLTGKYYLTNDIDFSIDGTTSLFKDEIIQGEFKGTLDGQGFTLKGFSFAVDTYNDTQSNNSGVFENLADGAVIKNLKLGTAENPILVAFRPHNGAWTRGAVLSTFANGTVAVTNVHIYTTFVYQMVRPAYNGTKLNGHGGFIGDNRANITFRDCSFNGDVLISTGTNNRIGTPADLLTTPVDPDTANGKQNERSGFGGFIGLMMFKDCSPIARFYNCTNNATIRFVSPASLEAGDDSSQFSQIQLGGFIGRTYDVFVGIGFQNCTNAGEVAIYGNTQPRSNAGGFIGIKDKTSGIIGEPSEKGTVITQTTIPEEILAYETSIIEKINPLFDMVVTEWNEDGTGVNGTITPDGETPDGETPDGETPDGETPDGGTPNGGNNTTDDDKEETSDEKDTSDKKDEKTESETTAADTAAGCSSSIAAMGALTTVAVACTAVVARKKKKD